MKECLFVTVFMTFYFVIPFVYAKSDDQIIINQPEKFHQIGTNAYFLEDANDVLTIDDILQDSSQQHFQHVGTKVFSRPATKSSFWFKITIKNELQQKLWLEIGEPLSGWWLDFYAPDETGTYRLHSELGALRPQKNKYYSADNYYVPIEYSGEPITYYLYSQGFFPISHIFQIGTLSALSEQAQKGEMIFYIFIGLMLAMILHNLFLIISTRDKIYFIYVIYLIGILFGTSFSTGHPLFYGVWAWEKALVWSLPITCIPPTWFSVVYLDLKKYKPKTYYVILSLAILMGVIVPVCNLLDIGHIAILMNVVQGMMLIYLLILLFVSVSLLRQGHTTARFYVLGWTFSILGVIGFVLTINNILPYNALTSNLSMFGYEAETILFAFALGDRFNLMRKAKKEAEAKNTALIKSQNEELEIKVQERTIKLQQQQEELLAQRDLLAFNNIELEDFKYRISQSINMAKTIQDSILPLESTFKSHFAEHFVLYLPKDVVSGDFYWLHAYNQNRKIIIEADCTGHGVPGAFMTLIGHAIFNQVVRIEKKKYPKEIMHEIDRHVRQLLQQSTTGNLSGMDLSIVVFEREQSQDNWKVTFGGSGQKLYYFEDDKLNTLKSSRRKIGGNYVSKFIFEETCLQMPNDTILYLSSDGYIDQNDNRRVRFGTKKFLKLLEEIHTLPLSQQKHKLMDSLQDYQQQEIQRDDITVVGLKL